MVKTQQPAAALKAAGPQILQTEAEMAKTPTLADIELEEKAILARNAELEKQKAELEAAKKQAIEYDRSRKLESRDKLLADAQDYRELSRDTRDPEAGLELLQKAKAAEAEAARIAADLGLMPAVENEAAPEGNKILSTTKGLVGVLILGLLALLAFYTTGTSLVSNAENDSAVRMMNSVGLRILTNFLPVSLAFLTAFGFLYLLFPAQFNYWHNRIRTHQNLQNDLENASGWQRIVFFSFCVALPVWAYVQLMQVIFG